MAAFMSALSSMFTLPKSHASSVGDLIGVTPSGSVPFQRGPTSANSRFSVPEVRLPSECATLVQASSIAIR